ncbi:MAG TPA: hypothetical protein VES97_09815 [Solirubrobacteraceae bacterium]|nr:hypothetical protein [Solirubrobacteraceae bacterium]
MLVRMAAPRLRELPALKDRLGINIELASPPAFRRKLDAALG